MARQLSSGRKHDTGRTITSKTAYGTTSEMVVTDEKVLSEFDVAENWVLVKDDLGYYTTPRSRVDSGLADPNRYSQSRGA